MEVVGNEIYNTVLRNQWWQSDYWDAAVSEPSHQEAMELEADRQLDPTTAMASVPMSSAVTGRLTRATRSTTA